MCGFKSLVTFSWPDFAEETFRRRLWIDLRNPMVQLLFWAPCRIKVHTYGQIKEVSTSEELRIRETGSVDFGKLIIVKLRREV